MSSGEDEEPHQQQQQEKNLPRIDRYGIPDLTTTRHHKHDETTEEFGCIRDACIDLYADAIKNGDNEALVKEQSLSLALGKYIPTENSYSQRHAALLIAERALPQQQPQSSALSSASSSRSQLHARVFRQYRQLLKPFRAKYKTVERLQCLGKVAQIHPKAVPAVARRRGNGFFLNLPADHQISHYEWKLEFFREREKEGAELSASQKKEFRALVAEGPPSRRSCDPARVQMAEKFTDFQLAEKEQQEARAARRLDLQTNKRRVQDALDLDSSDEASSQELLQLQEQEEALAAEEVAALKNGTKFAGTCVHDLMQLYTTTTRGSNSTWSSLQDDSALESQFVNLVSNIRLQCGDNQTFLCILDESGSMAYGGRNDSGPSPLVRARGLLATCLQLMAHPHYITYSSTPTLVDFAQEWRTLKAKKPELCGGKPVFGLRDTMEIIQSKCSSACSTNWEATVNLMVEYFRLVGDRDRPAYVLVFTDGHFDSVMNAYSYNGRGSLPAGDVLRGAFERAGLAEHTPKVICWNVNVDGAARPASATDPHIIDYSSNNPESLVLISAFSDDFVNEQDEAIRVSEQTTSLNLMLKCMRLPAVSDALCAGLQSVLEGYRGREVEEEVEEEEEEEEKQCEFELLQPDSETANGMAAFTKQIDDPLLQAALDLFQKCQDGTFDECESRMIAAVTSYMDLVEQGPEPKRPSLIADALALSFYIRDIRNTGKGCRRSGITAIVQILARVVRMNPSICNSVARVVLQHLAITGSWGDITKILVACTTPENFRNPRPRGGGGLKRKQQAEKKRMLQALEMERDEGGGGAISSSSSSSSRRRTKKRQ